MSRGCEMRDGDEDVLVVGLWERRAFLTRGFTSESESSSSALLSAFETR